MGENFTKKEQIVILLIGVLIILLVGFKGLGKNIFPSKLKPVDLGQLEEEVYFEEDKSQDNIDEKKSGEEPAKEENIMVHISGQVKRPGLIELKEGQRLVDAVDLAGGLKDEADLDRINLAKKLGDEDKIYIPAQGEDIDIEGLNLEISSGTGESGRTDGLIDINACDASQLQSLPGIGQVLATRIIDYREKTPFKSLEDLMNVSGIGEKKFQDIKDLVIIK